MTSDIEDCSSRSKIIFFRVMSLGNWNVQSLHYHLLSILAMIPFRMAMRQMSIVEDLTVPLVLLTVQGIRAEETLHSLMIRKPSIVQEILALPQIRILVANRRPHALRIMVWFVNPQVFHQIRSLRHLM